MILITKNLSKHFKEISSNKEAFTIQKRITQSDFTVDILPIMVEKTELPEILVGFTSIICYGQKPELISAYINEHVNLIFDNKRPVFKQVTIYSIILLALLFFSFALMNIDSIILLTSQKLIVPFFVMSLGALGSVSYIFLNILEIISQESSKTEQPYEIHLRIIFGAIIGWASYIIISNTEYSNSVHFIAITVIVAFLSGFSSKLVMEIINQGISLVERGIGIDAKAKKH